MVPGKGWAAAPTWLVILIAALVAIAPLLVHGCSCGHDFDFHLASWMDAANQLRHGNLHPHWEFSAAYNAGEPRFVFYPPLSWYLGAALGLLLTHLPGVSEAAGWNATPVLYTFTALALAGWTMYRLAREFAGSSAATLAAVLYLANPYMLFTAYERTAYGELLAAAWMPMLFRGILRENVTLPRIAVPVALLWLTNAPAAVIGSYTLALLALLRIGAGVLAPGSGRRWLARLRGSLQLAICTFAGTALGLMVAAFYVVPAAYERRYVQIALAMVPGMRISDNFLFHHTGANDSGLHDQVLHTASLIAVGLWIFGVLALAAWWATARRQSRRPAGLPVLALAVVLLAVGFVLTPWSGMFWSHAPEVAFLQFPWRATSVLAIVACVGYAAVLSQPLSTWRGWRVSVLGMVAAIALAWPAYRGFQQACDPEEIPGARLAQFEANKGTDPTDEYTPAGADNEVLHQDDPPWWLAAKPDVPPPAGAALHHRPAPAHIDLRSPRAAYLVLNLRAYPAWEVWLDGAPDLQRVHRDDGLLTLPVPSGASTVDIRWVRLPDQKIGDLTTLIGLGLLTASMLPGRWRIPHPRP